MISKPNSNSIVLDWKMCDSSYDLPAKPGLYLFTLANLNDMPFYVGTALGKNGLKQRLTTYKAAFANGEKTYITSFENIENKTDFRSSWLRLKNHLYIPLLTDFKPTHAGLHFWEHELRKYYADISELSCHELEAAAKDIEARLQQNIRSQLNLTEKEYEIKKPALYLGQSTPNGSTTGRKIHSTSNVLNDSILKLLSCD